MKNMSIARRYAKALLLIGKEDGKSETYREELNGFSVLLEKEKNLAQVICNPLFDAASRKRVLQSVISKLNMSYVIETFLLLLFDKGRIGFLSTINQFYQKLADELKGVARGTLVSATELSSDTVEKIQASLSKKIGKQIILDVEENPALIGGIVTRIGDYVIDGSVLTQLSNMKESLTRGESI